MSGRTGRLKGEVYDVQFELKKTITGGKKKKNFCTKGPTTIYTSLRFGPTTIYTSLRFFSFV